MLFQSPVRNTPPTVTKNIKIMAHINDENVYERIDQLIRLKATGNFTEISSKLNISVSQFYRIIKKMKEDGGCPIIFCRNSNSYVYLEKGRLIIDFKFKRIEEIQLSKIKGGIYKLYFLKK